MLDLLNLPGISPTEFKSDSRRMLITAEFTGEDISSCLQCGKTMYRHGHRKGTFADTPLHMRPVRLEISRPRYRCDVCGTTSSPDLTFLDERRRATKRLVDAIRERCLDVTFRNLAEHSGLAVNTIKNITLDLIAELERTVRYETPVIMGIDEVSIAKGYRCVITNLATNNVFQILEERTQDCLKPFFKNMRDRERVEWVCTDMWRPFKRSFTGYLPNARLVIEKFHLVKMASEAMETERKKFQSTLVKEDRVQVKKSVRWLTLKRPKFLSPAEQGALEVVREVLPLLADAYDLKEAFYQIYDQPDKESAQNMFLTWEKALPGKGFDDFRGLAKMVHRHHKDIFAYWDSPSRITNAYTECLNGLMKISNRIGCGYSYEVIRAKTLYSKHARKVGTGLRIPAAASPYESTQVEYGPHIPTLVDMTESGELE